MPEISKRLDCPPISRWRCGRPRSYSGALWPDHHTSQWVKELKRVSNDWLKEQERDYKDFQWQGGYSDFSVSQSNVERVIKYIANQREHRRKMSFQDELRALLRKHKIEWDERYVWD